MAAKPVVWTSMVNASASGNTITKTNAAGWNAGGISTRQLDSGDGYVEFTVTQQGWRRICGLSHGDTNQDSNDIDFGFYLTGAFPYLATIENGVVDTLGYPTYANGDTLRVTVEGGVIKYRQNGTLLKTSGSPTYPLLVDCSIYEGVGCEISNVMIDFFMPFLMSNRV
jgi:hypothetical protein